MYLSVHDYQHVGLSNNFLVEAGDGIAIQFNDQSCLEVIPQILAYIMEMQKDDTDGWGAD